MLKNVMTQSLSRVDVENVMTQSLSKVGVENFMTQSLSKVDLKKSQDTVTFKSGC